MSRNAADTAQPNHRRATTWPRSLPRGVGAAWVVAYGLIGWLLAADALRAAEAARSDRALMVGGWLGAPLALVALGLLTTPRSRDVRAWLGERGDRMIERGLRALVALVVASLPGALAAAFRAPAAGPDALRIAGVTATATVGAGLGAAWAILIALGAIARGLGPAWRSAAGGGVFGPAQTAPLLYAPAFGFVVGMLPAVGVAAAWGALGARLPPTQVLFAPLAVGLAGLFAVRQALGSLGPGAWHALVAVAEAHRMPFRQGEALARPGRWLTAGLDARGQATARAWVRRFPASIIVSLTAGVGLGFAGAPGPVSAFVAALGVTVYGGLRVADLVRRDPDATRALGWLDPGRGAPHATRALALRLAVPSALAAALGLAVAGEVVSGGAGAALGVGCVRLLPLPWYQPARAGRIVAAGRAMLAVGVVAGLGAFSGLDAIIGPGW
jgi:hypothetical protein